MTSPLRAKLKKGRRNSAAARRIAPDDTDPRDLLASVVEYSNDAIFTRGFDGVVTTWNAAAERVFGYSRAEMIGRSSRILLPTGQRDELGELVARLRRGEVIRQFETVRLRKDAKRVHVSLTLSPVRDLRRRLAGFSTIARDITEERQRLDAVARREHELQDLFDEASVGLVVLARTGAILRANRAFHELLDRPSTEVAGRLLKDFFPNPSLVDVWLDRLADRQTLHNFSTELLTRAGPPLHVLVDANALWDNGRFVHSRWFVRDISRRKQLEQELLELSERERRGFAQELHDGLGQQLGGVAYLSNVLRERLAERGAPEAGDAAHIFGLVREAIEQTRGISRGLSPIRPEPDGLMSALRRLAAQTSELFGVRCHFDCRQPVPIEDSVLASHFYRIAQEAVNNALKHAQPRLVRIRLRRVHRHVVLVITDDGIGIGPVSPRRQGMGLQIMQHRAGLVRGVVTVRRRRARGTEVACTAPCGDAQSAAARTKK